MLSKRRTGNPNDWHLLGWMGNLVHIFHEGRKLDERMSPCLTGNFLQLSCDPASSLLAVLRRGSVSVWGVQQGRGCEVWSRGECVRCAARERVWNAELWSMCFAAWLAMARKDRDGTVYTHECLDPKSSKHRNHDFFLNDDSPVCSIILSLCSPLIPFLFPFLFPSFPLLSPLLSPLSCSSPPFPPVLSPAISLALSVLIFVFLLPLSIYVICNTNWLQHYSL